MLVVSEVSSSSEINKPVPVYPYIYILYDRPFGPMGGVKCKMASMCNAQM